MIGLLVRLAAVLALSGLGLSLLAAVPGAQTPAPSTSQDQFVPVDSLPPADEMPAAPLLIAAYAFVWVALMIYLWSLWRRLGRVEEELARLRRKP